MTVEWAQEDEVRCSWMFKDSTDVFRETFSKAQLVNI